MMQSSSPAPLFHAAAPARRGRLPGARALVVRDVHSRGVARFAFVCSCTLGWTWRIPLALHGLLGDDQRPALCPEPPRGVFKPDHRSQAPARAIPSTYSKITHLLER